ncbi:unnamed protein product [Parajaminaea phylloscopi]
MQGFNMGRYRPPDADPRRDAFNGDRHALGKRAHKINQGILVVRFELPFSIWCGSCEGILIQGTRYNAEKRRVGEYYSTPLWAFRAKCRHCSAAFEIQTDPKNTRYIVTEGARKKVEEWDPEEEGNGAAIVDLTTGPAGRSSASGSGTSQNLDPFAKLDKETSERERAAARTQRILELEAHTSQRWSDPYLLNSKLRSSFRAEKKEAQAKRIEEQQFRDRIGWKEGARVVGAKENDAQHAQSDREEWKRGREEQDQRAAQAGKLPATASESSGAGVPSKAQTRTPTRRSKTRSSSSQMTSAKPASAPQRPSSRTSTVASMNPTARRLAAKIMSRSG